MADCRTCGRKLGLLEMVAGICDSCASANLARSKELAAEAAAQSAVPKVSPFAHIGISTESSTFGDFERLGLVSSVVIFGSHVGKDIMAAWRDAFGGRAVSAEKLFNDAREACLDDLRAKADGVGATDIIALQLAYQDLTGNGKNMIMATAHGTAVRRAK